MAVDVSKIPNNNKFDPVRKAILQLQDDITSTGASVGTGTVTVQKATGSNITINTASSTSFGLNDSNNSTITIGLDDSGYYSSSGGTISGDVSITGSLTITSNLTVNGDTIYLNTQTIEVEDNIIELNRTQADPDTATATTSGIQIYRGDGVTPASFIFDDADDTWDLTDNLAVAGNVTGNNLAISNWNTAYSYTELGHLRLSVGGTITGNVTVEGDFTADGDITLKHSSTDNSVDGITITNEDGDGLGNPYTGVLSVETGNKLTWNGSALLTSATGDFVTITGTQTITGDKTFSSNPSVENGSPSFTFKDTTNNDDDAFGQIIWRNSDDTSIGVVGFYAGDARLQINAEGKNTYVHDSLEVGTSVIANSFTSSNAIFKASGAGGNTQITIENAGSAGASILEFDSDLSSSVIQSNEALAIKTENTAGDAFVTAMTIHNSTQYINIPNRLAIGKTTAPSTQLDISGGILASGNITTNAGGFYGNGSGLTNVNADTLDTKHATDFTLDYVTTNGSSTANSVTVGDLDANSLSIGGILKIDSSGDFQISGFDFTSAITVTDDTTGYPLKLYGVDTTVGSISTELDFYSGYDGGWYIENQTGSTYGASVIRILGREVEYGGIELTYNNTLIGGFYGDGIDLNNNTDITGTLSVSSTTTLSGTTNLYYTQLKDSLMVLDPNGSSFSTAIYRDGVNPHKFMGDGSGLTNLGNADTVDSKHATDFTLDYVTNNGASTVNSIAIGQTTTTSHKLYINGGTSTNIPLKIKSENISTSGYAEMHIANDAEYKLILGSIGSNYSSTDWANSSYIYDTGQSYLRIKASSEMQLFSGGYTVASHKTLTLQSDGDVIVERGKLYTNNIYSSDTIYFNRGDSDFSNIIRSQGYPSGGYTAANQKYWLEYSTKGGHHFVVNTDGGAGSSENNYDDFTIWQGSVDGDRLLSVSNVGNTDIYGNLHVHNDGTFTEQVDGVALYLDSISESYATRLRFRKNTNDFWSIDSKGTSEGNDLKFYRYNAGWDAVMTMDWANGYVGIQADPSYPLHVAGKIYSTTEVQGGAATMRSYGGYAFFGSNSLSVPIAIGRDGTEYDIKITASGNTELGGNLKTETIGGSETISVGNFQGQRTMMPKNGAKFLGNSSTGAIRLKSPINAHTDSFHTFKGTIYQYQAGGTFEFLISGYYSGTTWYNTSATIKGTSDKNFTVRFGRDSNNAPLVYIGETTSTWSYAYVYLSEVNYGWSMSQTNMDNYMDGWTISGSHTAFENVTATTSDALITSWSRNGNSVYYTNPVAIGSNTTYAPLDVTSSTSGSSGVVQYSYNSSPSSYRLRLDTEVSSGLVKWKWNMLNAGASYNDVMVFDRGRIGIGITPSSDSRLTVYSGTGNAYIQSYTPNGVAYFGSISSGDASVESNNAIRFTTGATYTERMRIDSSGNVGVGISPSAVGNYKVLSLNGSGGSGAYIALNSDSSIQAEMYSNASEMAFYTYGTRSQTFYTGGSESMRIDSSGRVGIGGPPTSTVRLSTRGLTNTSADYSFEAANSSGNSLFLVRSDGNVGIGITSPNQKLDVDGNVKIGTWATSGSRYVGFGRNDSGAFGTGGASGLEIESVFASGNGSFDQNVHLWTHWYNNGSQRVLTATWNRRVGVNNTNPSQALDVSGNIKLGNQSGQVAAPNFIDLGNNYSDGYTRDKCKIYLYNSGSEQYGFSVGKVGDVQYHSNVNHDHYIGNVRKTRLNSTTLDVYSSLRAGNNGYDSTPNGTSFSHTLSANSGTNRVVNFDGNGSNPSVWWNNGNSAKGAIDALDEGLAFWCNNNSGGWYRNFYIEPDRTIFERNVGIGVTSPSPYKLSVSGETHLNNGTGNGLTINTTVADNYSRNAIQLYEDDGQATGRQCILWYNGNMSYTKARLWTEVGSGYAGTKFGIDVADNARSVSTRLWIYNGDTYISGTFNAAGDVVAYYSSDKRLKDNIKPIQNPIEKIKKIGGYEFDWNDNQSTYQGHDIGVIAQEIEEVAPELVKDREDGFKAVKYEKLVALLIEGMKEQQQQIDMQQQQIDELKKLIK